MMTSVAKRSLDAAVDELKRNGYMVLIVMLDQKADQNEAMGSAVEVMCSETNDPQLLGAMLRTTLEQLTGADVERRVN